jgi:hypothetical protein
MTRQTRLTWPCSTEGEEPAPCVVVSAAAAYPTLCITDAACPGVAKAALWRQLSLNALNAALATDPTELEVEPVRYCSPCHWHAFEPPFFLLTVSYDVASNICQHLGGRHVIDTHLKPCYTSQLAYVDAASDIWLTLGYGGGAAGGGRGRQRGVRPCAAPHRLGGSGAGRGRRGVGPHRRVHGGVQHGRTAVPLAAAAAPSGGGGGRNNHRTQNGSRVIFRVDAHKEARAWIVVARPSCEQAPSA